MRKLSVAFVLILCATLIVLIADSAKLHEELDQTREQLQILNTRYVETRNERDRIKVELDRIKRLYVNVF